MEVGNNIWGQEELFKLALKKIKLMITWDSVSRDRFKASMQEKSKAGFKKGQRLG